VKVHNHGTEDGPGPNCNERLDASGRRVGACMSGAGRVLYVDLHDVLGPVGVAELITGAAAREGER